LATCMLPEAVSRMRARLMRRAAISVAGLATQCRPRPERATPRRPLANRDDRHHPTRPNGGPSPATCRTTYGAHKVFRFCPRCVPEMASSARRFARERLCFDVSSDLKAGDFRLREGRRSARHAKRSSRRFIHGAWPHRSADHLGGSGLRHPAPFARTGANRKC